MKAAVVYDGVIRTGDDKDEPGSDQGKLFSDYKLWFSRAVPQRDWLIQNAQSNGATIVPLEKQADVLLVDHARKNQPPGTHSYKWVELSIRNGRLEDLADHAVNSSSRADRPVGSTIVASKGGRTPFTAEEDQFLWNLMRPFVDRGGQWKGNEIYKQIERIRPRHTYQSWRDHWIKVTQFQNRQITQHIDPYTLEAREVVESTPQRPQTPPRKRTRDQVAGQDARERAVPIRTPAKKPRSEPRPSTPEPVVRQVESPCITPASQRSDEVTERPPVALRLPGNFTVADTKLLYRATRHIMRVDPVRREASWTAMAGTWTHHTAAEWKLFWEAVILPEFCRRRGKTVEEVAAEILESEEQEANDQKSVVDEQIKEQVEENVIEQAEEEENSSEESSPGMRTCVNCFTTETDKWRHDKAGRPLCNECGQFLKQTGVLRPSTAWTEVLDEPEEEEVSGSEESVVIIASSKEVTAEQISGRHAIASTPTRVDVGVQTSPISVPQEQKQKLIRSPSPELQSSVLSRPPEPNEARKRSAGRSSQSNSQDSKSSKEQAKSLPTNASRQESPQLPAPPSTNKKRKRPQLHDEPFTLEIPPTPENVQSSIDALRPLAEERADSGSPIRKGQIVKGRKVRSRTDSPLFVPEHSEEEATDSTPSSHQDLRKDYDTSPLKVDLLSDQGQSSPILGDDEGDLWETQSTASAYAFETAPEVSENWETAPESPQSGSEEQEEVSFGQEKRSHVANDLANIGVFPFGLDLQSPHPKSLRRVIQISSSPPVSEEENNHEDQPSQLGQKDAGKRNQPAKPASNDSIDHHDIDSWLTAQSSLYPSQPDLDVILHAVIEATSFDFALASHVVKEIISARIFHDRNPVDQHGAIRLPTKIRGCWTAEDDNLLLSKDEKDVDRVQRKHGEEGCIKRYEFLEAWMAN